MESLIVGAVLVGLFGAGIGLVFLIADPESPASRALAFGLGVMGAIFFFGGVRHASLVPEVPYERAMSLLEAGGVIGVCEWIRRVGRTIAPAHLASSSHDRRLRAAQGFAALHGLVGVALIETRLRYAHGAWAGSVLLEPEFYLFATPLLLAIVLAGTRVAEIARADIDRAERLRLRAAGLAAPFLLSGIPLTPPWEYLTTALGELILLAGAVRYHVVQGQRGQFLARFLSPQVARLVRERGLASAIAEARAQISVVACDLRGFTASAEAAAPEELMKLVGDYYDSVGRVVTEFGGTIKDFAGDGILVLVGAPIPYPDHARRAVDMAREIRACMSEVLERWRKLGLDLGLGIGIASGFVTVGTVGGAERLEYAAIGPAVNLAARLCDRAEAGEILVDQRTVGLAGPDGRFEELGPVDLKGVARPVAVYRALQGRPRTSDRQQSTKSRATAS